MGRPLLVWGTAISGLVVYDIRCDRNEVSGDTLSEVVRAVFHVEHPLGAALFVGCWTALNVWFVPHILRAASSSSRALSSAHA